SCGGAGSVKSKEVEKELVGTVYVMGNEPFTRVAIKLDDGQVYALLGEHEKALRALEGQKVRVKGEPSEEKPRGADAVVVKSFEVVK
ncbi:MAG TPA: hypothetical protein VLS90_17455, partial [Thermodesulfobacteriota bacterium]|nr:hypothetical protein [Thermodesulfobacteriota bacterium]